MTYYEFQDLLSGIVSSTSGLAAIFFTVFAAFVVCVYVVGSKLDRYQAIAITLVYSGYSLFLMFLIYGQVNRIGVIVAEYNSLETTPTLVSSYIGLFVFVLGWLLSVTYMVQVRNKSHKKQDSANDT